MSSISPAPTFDLASQDQLLQNAADMPMSPIKTFAWGIDQGIQSSFGLGTALRGGTTPVGNEPPPIPTFNPLIDTLNAPQTLRYGIEHLGRLISGQQDPPLSEADYKASPYYRTAVPWDPGMTTDRAAALASQYDTTQAKDYYGAKDPAAYMVGNFVGGATDPINYIPIFGEAAKAAAVAQWGLKGLGKVALESGVNAAEAATNTALGGMLTAQQREQYGDDVSWNAQINNIAMSALIGAVVHPILSTLGAGIDRLRGTAAASSASRVEDSVETIPNVMAARQVTNDAVQGLADNGEVNLTPASATVVQRLANDVTAKRDAAVALNAETEGVTADKPGSVVITPSGARVEVQPQVVDLSTLQPASGALQVRDRTRAASAAQIEEMGRTLDPARLMPSVEADRGAPVVGSDNIIDSGNGRVAAIQRAYEAYPEQAQAYRAAIEAQGYDTTGMQQPVLIQRRVTDLSPQARAQFNAEANGSATARMSPTETAAMDSNALDDGTLQQLADGPVTSAANRPFVQRFMNRLPSNERGALLDAGGNLSPDGGRRIERALVSAAYGDIDPGVVRRFSEATDDNSTSIVGAMSDVAGRWALMRRAIQAGEIAPEFDMTPDLTTALRRLSDWRTQAASEGRPVPTVIKEGMRQLDMLDGEMSLEAKTLVRAFYKTDEFNRSAGRDIISARLGKILDAVEEAGRPQLFGEAEAATKLGVLNHAIDDQQADLFASADAATGTDGLGRGREQPAPGADRGDAAQGSLLGEGDRPGAAADSGTIADRMTERFVAAGRPRDEAQAIAAMVEAFYATAADRMGTTPGALEERFGLPEVTKESGAATINEALFQPAYHGTPHIFDKFDSSKIGTGEGAQAFGHGLYFAGRKGVAEYYRDKLSKAPLDEVDKTMSFIVRHPAPDGNTGARLDQLLDDTGVKLTPEERDLAIRAIEGGKPHGSIFSGGIDYTADAVKAMSELDTLLSAKAKGRLLTVDIPHDDELLDWDKPLSEQPAGVKENLATLGIVEEAKPERIADRDLRGIVEAAIKQNDGDASRDSVSLVVDNDSDLYRKALAYAKKKGLSADDLENQGGVGAFIENEARDYLAGLNKRYERTGESIYREIQNKAGGDPVAASAVLRDAGIPGHRFLDQQSRDKTEGQTHNYVIYDDSRVNVTGFEQSNRASINFGDDGRAVIRLFDSADASSAIHEFGHFFLHMFKSMAEGPDAPAAMRDDLQSVKEWWASNAEGVAADSPHTGVTADDVLHVLQNGTSGDQVKDLAIDVGLQEQWARGFERYVREGNAPSSTLERVFEQFKNWLTSLYRSAHDLKVNISPEIRGVFNRLLAGDRDKATAEAPRAAPAPATDMTPPRPDEPPEGLAEAAARVGSTEDFHALAAQHGVAPDGSFPEEQIIDMLREQDALTAEDKAELDAADETAGAAKAWGDALVTAARCAFGML